MNYSVTDQNVQYYAASQLLWHEMYSREELMWHTGSKQATVSALVQIDAHCAVANLACLSSTCIIQKCIDWSTLADLLHFLLFRAWICIPAHYGEGVGAAGHHHSWSFCLQLWCPWWCLWHPAAQTRGCSPGQRTLSLLRDGVFNYLDKWRHPWGDSEGQHQLQGFYDTGECWR